MYDVFDDRFVDLIAPSGELEHLADGCAWAEGPVYVAAERALYWSDVRNDRRMRFDEATGEVSEAERPANFCNGHTLDRDGVIVACEHGTRSVVRWWPDGRRETVADSFDGKRLNSPNDVVVASDGAVWFTDPTYGIDSDAEGYAAESEIGSSNVYRVHPATGEVTVQITDLVRPNGLAFSPDETRLFVSDTGVSHVEGGPRHIRVFDVDEPVAQVTGGGGVFATCPAGVFDGFRFDDSGRLWASGEQGVHVYTTDGVLLGTIRLPETCANLEFAGDHLYMTATTSLYRLRLR
ncbi:gluconolactonase [Ilumatobacter fluminis]|uniref:Gluconolactonase n=1 Tax=Ilumatobacter fluminis TaxID=467091 RepID=A0A4V3EIY9_9ACTN|nr:gluconolactonase [Ilumatobacter fluminis]